MNSKKYFFCAALLSTLLAAEVFAEDPPKPESRKVEKCFGVAKAGKNDCAARDGSNSCAGHSKKDSDSNNWIYVPLGLCEKLVGGVKESK
jgi:uncharacterized membrane protein